MGALRLVQGQRQCSGEGGAGVVRTVHASEHLGSGRVPQRVAGQPVDVDLTYSIPPGMTIDTNFLLNATNGQLEGACSAYDTSQETGDILAKHVGFPQYVNATTIQPTGLDTQAAATHTSRVIDRDSPFTWATGDKNEMTVRIPVLGWRA